MSDKKPTRALVYCGRRFWDEKAHDIFAEWLPDTKTDSDGDVGPEHSYEVKKKRREFAIGTVYIGVCDEEFSCDFSTFEPTGDTSTGFQITGWSARDTAARRAKYVHGTRKRLTIDMRASWLDAMEPLRWQYRKMTLMEQRAMRQLVLEWLEIPS